MVHYHYLVKKTAIYYLEICRGLPFFLKFEFVKLEFQKLKFFEKYTLKNFENFSVVL